MAGQDKGKRAISLKDAVGALSALMDFDLNEESLHDLQDQFLNQEEEEKPLNLLASYNGDIDMPVVRQVFRTILYHLENESQYAFDEKKTERMKTIMVLVGEAAVKLDKLTEMFHRSQKERVHDLKEFKDLQEFYISRIAKKIDQNMLGKWILGLAGQLESTKKRESLEKELHTHHVFIDLEGVKKDSEYELFFIRKEDGTRFFNPKLIRSIQLISDFGSYFRGEREDDPLVDMALLTDKSLHMLAKAMAEKLKSVIKRFYHEAATHKHNEIASTLHKAFIALYLAANPKNLLRNDPLKSCSEYFADFQLFFREALKTREYQHIMAYREQKSNTFYNCLTDTIENLASSLYLSRPAVQDAQSFVENLIHEAVQDQSEEHVKAANHSKQIWNKLASDYVAMTKLMKRHPNGHLNKILETIEEGNYKYFDPLLQRNIPMELYSLYFDDSKMVSLKIPAPVYQENIQKALITEEFKAFLRSLKNSEEQTGKLLIFNFQDRTSWKEHARAKALEDLQKNPEFKDQLTVVTFPKETEFYHQEMPYEKDTRADHFILHLKEHLEDEASGFYFPENISKKVLVKFADEAIKNIHHLFFNSKNVLTKEQRLDFIEIFYFFLELKVLELVKPQFFSLASKDGADVASCANATLFAFLTALNQEQFSENDKELLDFLIYGQTLITRERLVMHEKFSRMVNSLKAFEAVKQEHGYQIFSKIVKEMFVFLYDTPVLDAKRL